MTRLRGALVALVLIGSLTNVAATGTFASFTAATTNPSSTFQTGTIVLSNTKAGGGTCFSYGADPSAIESNANTCDALFSFAPNQVPGTDATVNLTLTADGTVDASAFELHVSTPCTSADDGGAFHGAGDLCDALRTTIQETDADFQPLACRFDTDSAGSACDTGEGAPTLATLTSTHGPTTPLALGTLPSGTSRWFQVRVALPNDPTPGADNAFMGKQASWGLSWVLEQ